MANLNVLDKRNRAAGTHQFSRVSVPANLRHFSVTADMDAPDIQDPTLTITWEIRAQFVANDPFVFLVGGGWQGGLDPEGNPMSSPNQTWSTSGAVPIQVEGEVTLSKRISIGFDVEVT